MLANQNQRLDIVLSLKDPLNWAEYSGRCKDAGIDTLSPAEYISKLSWLIAGIKLWPDKKPQDAYLEFVIKKGKIEEISYHHPQKGPDGEKTCCGEGKEDKSLPTLMEQTKNLAISVFNHAKDGFKNVDNNVLHKRNEMCSLCKDFRNDERCAKCGCFMKIKAQWESAKCPENKW